MRTSLQTGLCALALLLAACEPEERAQWAPDGAHAALLVDQRLYFTDTQGGISSPLADRDGDPGRFLVDSFDWLPDSSGLVLHRIRVVPEWTSCAALLPRGEADRVESLAASLPALLKAAVALHGDADRPEILLANLAPTQPLALGNAFRLALSWDPASIRGALSGAPTALASLEGKAETPGFFLHEVAVLRPDSPGSAEVRLRCLRGIHSLRVSPTHPVAAVHHESGDPNLGDLVVLALDRTAPPLAVAAGVTRAFDWSPDGKSLIFMSPVSNAPGGLVEIERRRVLEKDGQLPGELPEDPANGELAFAVVAFAPRLAVLPGGEVLFSSHSANLPAAAADLQAQPRLFVLPAAGGPPVEVPTEAGALPMDLGYFVPSPDGRRLVVVESGTDAVAVVDLASGKSELVSPPHPGWKTRLMPSWRSAGEFTFAAPDPDSKRVRWMLWKEGQTTDLSAAWPDTITKSWMEFK